MRISRVVPAVLVALAAAVSLSAQKTPPAFTQVLPMPSPAPEGAGEPGLISDGRGHVILSWLEPAAGGVTRFRMSRFTGNTATEPVTIAQGSNFFVNWADVPSVFRAANDVLMAHWLERGGANRSAYDIKLAVSADAGRTWIPSGTPHRDGKEAEHGFVSFFNHPRGGVGLIWLDGREMASHGGDHMTAGPAATMLRTTQVATGAQGPRAFGDDIAVDPKVCDCCSTSAATTSEGVIVAYRDRSDKEVRDISVSRFDGKTWSAPTSVHADNWEINACPVNGPVVVANGASVAVAWFTQAGGTAHSYVAFSKDAGRTFGAPVKIDSGTSFGRLSMVMPDAKRVLIGYIERAGDETSFLVRQVSTTGTLAAPVKIAAVSSERASGFPRMAIDGDRVVMAWTTVKSGRAAGVQVAALR